LAAHPHLPPILTLEVVHPQTVDLTYPKATGSP
jgi:hypothetical protein